MVSYLIWRNLCHKPILNIQISHYHIARLNYHIHWDIWQAKTYFQRIPKMNTVIFLNKIFTWKKKKIQFKKCIKFFYLIRTLIVLQCLINWNTDVTDSKKTTSHVIFTLLVFTAISSVYLHFCLLNIKLGRRCLLPQTSFRQVVIW